MERGVDLSLRSVTVSAFLDRWLTDTAAPRVRPSTLEIYRNHKKRYIDPSIGSVKLRALSVQQVNRMMADMVRNGQSPSTANRCRATLRNALASAVKWGYVPQNVAALADPRKVDRVRIKPLELEEVQVLLAWAEDLDNGPLIHVAIATGCRQGELLALRWSQDVDLENGYIHVRHTLSEDYASADVKAASTPQEALRRRLTPPKTEESRRSVKLSLSAVEALRRQQAINARYEMAAAHRWVDLDLVFPTTIGTPSDATAVTHRLRRTIRDASAVWELITGMGIPEQRFHDLRHCTASLLLAEGMDLFVVKEVLGHSQISLTANTYGHLMKKISHEAASRLDRAIQTGDVVAEDDTNPDTKTRPADTKTDTRMNVLAQDGIDR
ncbi:MAG: tyrosine-type recombinase/integrase [Thermomicrobiales bacterium]